MSEITDKEVAAATDAFLAAYSIKGATLKSAIIAALEAAGRAQQQDAEWLGRHAHAAMEGK